VPHCFRSGRARPRTSAIAPWRRAVRSNERNMGVVVVVADRDIMPIITLTGTRRAV
jgi:hypothetical protein